MSGPVISTDANDAKIAPTPKSSLGRLTAITAFNGGKPPRATVSIYQNMDSGNAKYLGGVVFPKTYRRRR